jgi:ribonuclease Y
LALVLGYGLRQFIARNQVSSAESKVAKMKEEAERTAQAILKDAKEKADKIIEEEKKNEQQSRAQILRQIDRLEQKEVALEKKTAENEKEKNKIVEKVHELKNIKEGIEKIKEEQMQKLEKIATLTLEEAKTVLLRKAEKEESQILADHIKRLESEGQEEINKRTLNMVSTAMQRISISHVVEGTVCSVSIPNDEMKGRIIGREGRNIRTIEKLTGVEIIIDDTPEAITITSFNLIRQQIAKLAIEKLISDGRINPTNIENSVLNAKAEIMLKIKEAGEATVYDTGVTGLDPKLIQILGRLKFRTSYGQNALLHSIEVAHLSAAIAGEIGANVVLAKKAGLLHDIGKAVDHEIEGSHVELGKTILKKFNVSEEVIKVMQAHHKDYPFESIESIIVYVADAISASRPGARKDTLDRYLKRLGDLEAIANEIPEVEKSYAIQAGREIRVFVKPEKIDDLGAIKLARTIADKIEERLDYPGEIKVTVTRETKATEFAR